MKNDKTKRPRSLRPVAPATANQAAAAKHPQRTLATGLDILEYLANCQHPATLAAISEELNVTSAVINRSISVLEDRGYIVRNDVTQSYEWTGKLPTLQSTPAKSNQLLRHAGRIMQDLCGHISQSCNIAVVSEGDIQVIAEQASPGPFCINVPVGYRYDMVNSAPGLAFIAFASHADTARWPGQASDVVNAQAWSSLRKAVDTTAERGFAQAENPLIPDITDLSCPVYQDGRFVAVLTVPFLQTSGSASLGWSIAALQMAAELLSESLHGDSLVA
jgi:DNA-binding IclR family transcriptional regulator